MFRSELKDKSVGDSFAPTRFRPGESWNIFLLFYLSITNWLGFVCLLTTFIYFSAHVEALTSSTLIPLPSLVFGCLFYFYFYPKLKLRSFLLDKYFRYLTAVVCVVSYILGTHHLLNIFTMDGSFDHWNITIVSSICFGILASQKNEVFRLAGLSVSALFLLWFNLHQYAMMWEAFIYASSFDMPRSYKVHPYWSLNSLEPISSTNFVDLSVARAQRIFDQFPERLDYQVEKSKCKMYDYMEKNGMAHGDVLKMFLNENAKGDFWDWIKLQDSNEFPLVIKFCHLTQGSQVQGKNEGEVAIKGNTFFLSSPTKVKSDEFREWIETGFSLESMDPGRKWEHLMENPLKATPPGILIQRAWKSFSGLPGPLEVKFVVLWGKAYLARFEKMDGFMMRSSNRFRMKPLESLTPYDAFPWPFSALSSKVSDYVPNIERHLEAAKRLAEWDAQNMAIDFLRVAFLTYRIL